MTALYCRAVILSAVKRLGSQGGVAMGILVSIGRSFGLGV